MSKKLPVAIDEQEFTKLIKHTKNPIHKIAFLLGFGSGLRISEITNLEKRDINIKERKILVRIAKGGYERIVPLPKGFKESHLKHIPIPIGVRALQQGFKNSAARSGLLKTKPSAHFHSLRHGFATQSIKKNIPLHHVRTLLGHKNISTTNIYLVSDPQDALKSYEDLF